MSKIYLHCDMNNYFASVESIYDPSLNDVPMIVSGDLKARHGIVLARNNLAKEKGIIAGESVYSALAKVKDLKVVQKDYNKYLLYAKLARKIYQDYTQEIVLYGLDEAWLIFDNINYQKAIDIAFEIRKRVKEELKLSASIGISFNYVFSKLGSDYKKPDATTVFKKEDMESLIWKLPAFMMLYVGSKTRKKLKDMNILTIGDLACFDKQILKNVFGKIGLVLHEFANGNDQSFNPKVNDEIPFKNISNTITLKSDLKEPLDILSILYILATILEYRLKKHNLFCKVIGLKLKFYDFEILNHQLTLDNYTNSCLDIFRNLKLLLEKHYKNKKPIRALGVFSSKLLKGDFYQISIFDNMDDDLEIDKIKTHLKSKAIDFNLDDENLNNIIIEE